MLRATFLGTAVLFTLSGCARLAESPINPVNWFGNSQEAPVAATTSATRPLVDQSRRTIVVDQRALVQTVDSLVIDRKASGAIVRASGTAPTQGYYNAQLVNAGVSNGVLTLQFRAQAPSGFEGEGTARSRLINAAYVIDSADLAGIRTVRVESATNVRTTAR